MRPGKRFCFICLLLVFLVPACRDDKEKKEDYSVVSGLISERNKARQGAVEKDKANPPHPPSGEENLSGPKPESDSKAEDVSPVVLYEEKVNIVGADSQRTLAKGLAYINKQGQIVKIKILKE